MKPLNCRATDKCQIDISETPGYKELSPDIKKILGKCERTKERLLRRRKSKKAKK